MVVSRRLRAWVKTIGALIFIGTLGAGIWLSRPFVDRTLKGAHATEMPVLSSALSDDTRIRLTEFATQEAIGSGSLVVFKDSTLAYEFGPTDVPSNLHSGRKSILSLLFGIAQDKGLLQVSATLKELEIDEARTPLTETEKTATIAHLLQARSGVYLPSGAETENMQNARPARGSFLSGEHHYYNNWDFNVLGTIFEQETDLTIGQAVDQWLGMPLGLQDFHPDHVIYDLDGTGTQHATYRIHMSARDLARIGAMVQAHGQWGGQQVVSAAWIERSTQYVSDRDTRAYDGYGYLWWLNSASDIIAADGWGGQYMFIDRNGPYVLVSRQDTGNSMLGYVNFVFPSRKNLDDPLDLHKLHDLLDALN